MTAQPSNDGQMLQRLQKMLDDYSAQDNFNRVARITPVQLKATYACEKKIRVEFLVEKGHINNKETLHGGQTAALLDIVTARAVGMSVRDVPMVSVDLSISYMLPAKLGDTVTIEATCLKIGRTMAFTECEFRRSSDNALIAKGKHNIAFLNHLRATDGQSVNQF